jgi:hypothetical protein
MVHYPAKNAVTEIGKKLYRVWLGPFQVNWMRLVSSRPVAMEGSTSGQLRIEKSSTLADGAQLEYSTMSVRANAFTNRQTAVAVVD